MLILAFGENLKNCRIQRRNQDGGEFRDLTLLGLQALRMLDLGGHCIQEGTELLTFPEAGTGKRAQSQHLERLGG